MPANYEGAADTSEQDYYGVYDEAGGLGEGQYRTPCYGSEILQAASAPPIVLGDVDCDGAMTNDDALMITQYLIADRSGADCDNLASTGINLDAADVNNDGQIDIADALVASRCAIGAC